MAKRNVMSKVYTVNDFANEARISVAIEDCYWAIDRVVPTEVGIHSSTPLFQIEWRKDVAEEKTASGKRDLSSSLSPTRLYFCREGRSLYNELAQKWRLLAGDTTTFEVAVMNDYNDAVFSGFVARLDGIQYTKKTKNKIIVTKNSLELWYPSGTSEETILVDYVHMVNKGIYVPIEKPETPSVDGITPEMLEAIRKLLLK